MNRLPRDRSTGGGGGGGGGKLFSLIFAPVTRPIDIPADLPAAAHVRGKGPGSRHDQLLQAVSEHQALAANRRGRGQAGAGRATAQIRFLIALVRASFTRPRARLLSLACSPACWPRSTCSPWRTARSWTACTSASYAPAAPQAAHHIGGTATNIWDPRY